MGTPKISEGYVRSSMYWVHPRKCNKECTTMRTSYLLLGVRWWGRSGEDGVERGGRGRVRVLALDSKDLRT